MQVTYLLASEQTMEREFGVLEEIRDNYPKYVVLWMNLIVVAMASGIEIYAIFFWKNRGHEKRVCQFFDRLFFQSGERSTADVRHPGKR